MPEHTSFLSYLVAMFPALGKNMENFGKTFVGQHPVGEHQAEPIFAVALVLLLLVGIAFAARKQIADYDKSVVPDESLSLRLYDVPAPSTLAMLGIGGMIAARRGRR